jgi:cation:H+ antiporter
MILAWVALLLSFVILAKSADVFVDCAVDLAYALKIPKLIIGIVLVSLATTAPELSVSFISAIRGKPQMALGNAVGSVICNGGLALGLTGFFALAAIHITPTVLRLSGSFLILVQIVLFLFILPDLVLTRPEGLILVVLFVFYTYLLLTGAKRGKFPLDEDFSDAKKLLKYSMPVICLIFTAALAGIILASEMIVSSATVIAKSFGIPEAVIAMTLVALGTSIPEVATCVVAAKKGHGAVAVGNILGANIMNICWVAGASAMANDLAISRKEFNFMFPAMFAVMAVMLGLLWHKKRITRKKSAVLLTLYALYIAVFLILFGRG